MTIKRYESKPLECWQKVKELRLNFYKSAIRAKDEGKIFHTSCGEFPRPIVAAFGDLVHIQAEPYGASCGFNAQFAEACIEAFEAKGFARDVCAYMRNHLGSLYLNKYLFGGDFPKPDFVVTGHVCDTHGKWAQLVAEHFGVPYFCLDGTIGYTDEGSVERRVTYVASQLHELIDWLEVVTGRKFDEGRYMEAFNNVARCMSLWAEICNLNKAIPAPLDQKSMFTLYTIPLLMAHEAGAVAFYETCRDEIKWRVENQIAAVPTERCRLFHDSQPPWNFLKIFRYLEKYGAVCIGGHYGFFLTSAWEEKEDGTLGPAKTPMEMGMPMRNKDEMIQAYAEWQIRYWPIFECMTHPRMKNQQLLRMMKEWHTDGMIMHLNRGCEGMAFGQMENRLALLKAGYPVVTYEGNMADPREFDEVQALDRIEAFLQSLGLQKIED